MMKTWIFDEEALEETIRNWVDEQIKTGHPAAVKNAAFVAEAVRDVLNSNAKLFKVTDNAKPITPRNPPAQKYAEPQQDSLPLASVDKPQAKPAVKSEKKIGNDNLTIEDMKRGW